MLEHGAYTLLLDRYYTTEKPLPTRAEAHRVCRARSSVERAAVDAVLAEFFVTDGEAFMNRRAEEEITKAAHQRTVNQELGKRGGRPKQTEQITESVSELEPTRNPSQTPDSRLQEPNGSERARKRAARQCPADFAVTPDLLAWAAAEVPAVPLEQETAKFRDYTFKTALTDWPGAWRNWMRKALEYAPRMNGSKQSALESRNAATVKRLLEDHAAQ
jgi:uncharacterized protein YdaU (DUF1376 family)